MTAIKFLFYSLILYIMGSGFISCKNDLKQILVKEPQKIKHYIESKGNIPILTKAAFLFIYNKKLSFNHCYEFVSLYEKEAEIEGINSDIAFSQMCLETGFLRFGGTVAPEQNNFCGLGALNKKYPGTFFKTREEGVRAHIQHLKAYANAKPLKNKKVDPRFNLVSRGSAPLIKDLTGKWAMDPKYHQKIMKLLLRLFKYNQGIQKKIQSLF